MGTLEGTTALITGGSRGIGRAICLRLAEQGADIVLHYNRNLAAAEEVMASIGREVRLVHADLGSTKEIEKMFSELGDRKLDFLINNAGIWKGTPMGTSPAELVDEILDANIKGPFWVTQCALPLLKDGARIVNISSVAGRIGVAGGRSLYGATKAAIDSLTQSWALELAPRKILVNAIAPGYIATDMTADYFSDPAAFARALERHPLGRLGTPEDIADVVAFLCSDGARFITGQSINVSGGSVI
jgi:3-oxoacyl-[acyl-carrier protein] reductase